MHDHRRLISSHCGALHPPVQAIIAGHQEAGATAAVAGSGIKTPHPPREGKSISPVVARIIIIIIAYSSLPKWLNATACRQDLLRVDHRV